MKVRKILAVMAFVTVVVPQALAQAWQRGSGSLVPPPSGLNSNGSSIYQRDHPAFGTRAESPRGKSKTHRNRLSAPAPRR
jgi:hypothetical protein